MWGGLFDNFFGSLAGRGYYWPLMPIFDLISPRFSSPRLYHDSSKAMRAQWPLPYRLPSAYQYWSNELNTSSQRRKYWYKNLSRFLPLVSALVIARSSQSRRPAFSVIALASTCNAVLMRWHETGTGIEVLDSGNNVIGTSKIAAKRVRFCIVLESWGEEIIVLVL